MRVGNRWNFAKFVSYKEMLEAIETKYELERLQDHANDTSKVGS
jgi:molybdenum cofactor biosynthesis enzyme MoaA